MRLGLLLPQGYFNEFDGWNPHDAYRRVLEIASEAERRGFDSIWLGEHVLAKWNREEIAFECVSLATALAAAIPRVEIGFTVINSTFRNPAMTAKAAGTIDAVSGGRLVLGLGAGFKVSRGRRIRPRVSGPADTDGDPVRALRDHQPDDPARGPAVHVPRPPRVGRGRRQCAARPAAATTSRC